MWEVLGILVWLVFLLLAMPYVQRAKHPDAQSVAAYMVFIILFSAMAVVMYSLWLLVLGSLSAVSLLHHPLGAAIFLAMVFAPAFLLARWQLKKPPRKMPKD